MSRRCIRAQALRHRQPSNLARTPCNGGSVRRGERRVRRSQGKVSCLAQEDMGGALAGDVLRSFITQGTHVDAVEKILPGAEDDRAGGKMQLVDEPREQVLPNG